jgi:hypothetical protein
MLFYVDVIFVKAQIKDKQITYVRFYSNIMTAKHFVNNRQCGSL